MDKQTGRDFMQQRPGSIYDELGKEKIDELVEAFYKRVSQHPDLIPIFPDDFTETIRKQKQFLTQFFGGPPLYIEEHGHPMLRSKSHPQGVMLGSLACLEQ
jgi:hemoglobin